MVLSIPDYKILEKVNENDVSVIYRGLDINNDSYLLKIIKHEGSIQDEIERLNLEYELIKNINFEGVLKAKELKNFQSNVVMVLEDFNGISIRNSLIQNHKFDIRTFLEIAIKIVSVLEDLHKINIIHKDLRPENILFNIETKQIKIIDFRNSSAVLKNNSDFSLHIIKDSLKYISPEQTGRINRPVDYRTDFYSLGITFYEMLTGMLPFESEDPMELIHFHIAKKPLSPSEISSNIPQPVSDIIIKLLSKNPDERYKGAYGLRFDFEVCLEKLISSGEIDEFAIGKSDISDELIISEKLYGRTNQLESIYHSFQNVRRGYTEFVLVSGSSGIGKSTLVNKIKETVIQQKGYYIFGKFDQFKRNTPYSSIIQGFKILIRNILTESKEKLTDFKEQIIRELGNNIKIIIDIIPELTLIVGSHFNIQELEVKESQNRFNIALQKFIALFAQKEHPLVMRFDDLQWADSASLNLIKSLITEAKMQYLLIIGTFRDNEIPSNHPLLKIIEEIKKSDVTITNIKLEPLDTKNITELLSDTFHLPPEKTKPLAELIYTKTQGNPFFINESLKSLYHKKVIEFINGSGWGWNINEISKMQITENVIELMLDKLNNLSKNTLETLKIAACFGSRFSFETLAIACEKSQEETFMDLSEAINSGIILIMEDYQRFLHDKVQEATYSLIPQEKKKSIHYKIGKLLLKNNKEEDLENSIFDIVNHLNFGISLVTQKSEKYEIARLNLLAGKKAKNSTAFSLGLKYFKLAIEILDENSWDEEYNLTFSLFLESAECEYIVTNFLESERLFDQILKRVKTNLEKAKVYEVKVVLYIAMNKMKDAVNTGIEGLKLLGMNLPLNNKFLKTLRIIEFLKVNRVLKKDKINKLINLPVLKDEKKLICMNLMINISTAAYMSNTDQMIYMIFKMVNFSKKFGNSEFSSFSFSFLGMVLCYGLNRYEEGYQLGKIAIKLNEKFNSAKLRCKINFIFATLISHWRSHVKSDINLLLYNLKYGMESGDIVYIGYSVNHMIIKMFCAGDNLDLIYKTAKEYSNLIIRAKDSNILDAYNLRMQMIYNLKGLTYNSLTLSDENFNEELFFEKIIKKGTLSTLSYAYITKLQINFLYENYNEALIAANELEKFLSGSYGNVLIPEYYFYYSLTLTSLYEKASNRAKKKYIKILKINQNKMKIWADNCNENFLHKYMLIEAEILKLNGKSSQAAELYSESVRLAQKDGFVQNQAIANELAGRFYLSGGHELIAKEFILEAYNCYVKWGAKIKALDIERKYSYFFIKKSVINKKLSKVSRVTSGLASPEGDFELDLTSIVKASQTLSGEIFLDKLLDKLMKIMIESAGAQKGYLILKNKDELLIEAEGSINKEQIKLLKSIRLEQSNSLSHAIVNYVERTQKNVVINDAVNEGIFTTDPYILENKPKSILCIPIMKQSQLIGILYLENNLTTEAFTSDRIQILKLLSSQAAISLENAILYDEMRELNLALEQHKNNLEDMVNKKTRQLRLTQKRLLASAHSSGMAEIATGVLHNIGNILNSVNISNQILTDTLNNSKVDGLIKANHMLKDNMDNITDFLTSEPKGKKLLQYYLSIGDMLKNEYDTLEKEVKSLSGKINLMKDVISTQQSYAKTDFFTEKVILTHVVEDALSMQLESMKKHGIGVKKVYNKIPEVSVQKTKLLNVLMNILKNANESFENNTQNNKLISIEVNHVENKYAYIMISDNGEGIQKENMSKIFSHGFTTKKNGHGFGLHTCANSMTEMGGKLSVRSEGPDKGASFKLSFPIK